MPLIYLSCAWVAGILLGSKFDLPFAFVLIGLSPLPFLLYFHKHRKPIILSSLCLFALFAGILHLQSSLPTIDEHSLQFYNDQEIVEIKGTINADPKVKDKSTHLRLSAREIRLDNEWREVSGIVLLFVPRYSSYRYGDVLLVAGKLETPSQLNDFDYKGYLAQQGIYSTMLYPKMKIVERGKGFKPLDWIYSIRNRLSQTLATVLPEPQASLAQGILLGIRGDVPPSVEADFSRTGTAHILAISGLHLSIVAGILLSLGIWLFGRRRYIYIWLALGAIWFYALITGMQPPVVRAAIMASLFLTAELLGRQRSALTALAFAAAIMVGISPQILWAASFQMSFLAMAGLILIAPSLMSAGRKAVTATLGKDRPAVPIANIVADSFSITLGAIIAVWPVIAYYFGIIAPVAPLATLFALPALPAIIITGALTGGLGLIALPAAQVTAWLTWLFLSYMLVVVGGFAALPSHIEVGPVNTILLWVYYLALTVVIWLNSNRRKLVNPIPQAAAWLKSGASKSSDLASRLPKKWVFPPLLVTAVLVSLTAATMPDDSLHLSFLDVGEGDAIFIQTPTRQDILIDGGPTPQALSLGLGQKMPFWDRTIDLVILTHPHADHLTSLIEVLKRYKVKQVLSPDLDSDSPLYKEWLRLIEEKSIKYTIAQAGQQIDLGEGVIKVLNPQTPLLTDTESDIDNNGVVMRLSMGKVSFLLTADIGQEAEWELTNHRADLKSTALKVAHHGSATSSTPEFLAVVNPQLAVISVGADNRFGHPSAETLERLQERIGSENIYRTDELGTIEFITDGERLWVKAQR